MERFQGRTVNSQASLRSYIIVLMNCRDAVTNICKWANEQLVSPLGLSLSISYFPTAKPDAER